jgi:hypothetical protein
MYPKDATQLAALIAALVPFSIWVFSSLIAAQTRASERRSQEWLRISELARQLYNKEGAQGQWAQVAAIHELGDVRGKHQRRAAVAILEHAANYFAGHSELRNHVDAALARLKS